jgi:hypothetical protein
MSEHACKVCGNLGRPLGDYLGKNVCKPCFDDLAAGRPPICRSRWGDHVCTKPAMHQVRDLHSDGELRW